MDTLVVVIITLAIMACGYFGFSAVQSLYNKKMAENKRSFKEHKNLLKKKVRAIAHSQEKIDLDCLKVIDREIEFLCESVPTETYMVTHQIARIPSTLWDILKWFTLRNDDRTMEIARQLEKKHVSRHDPKFGQIHSFSTKQRIEALFNKKDLSPEAYEVCANLDRLTSENYRDLYQELSEYGEKLINREPRRQTA